MAFLSFQNEIRFRKLPRAAVSFLLKSSWGLGSLYPFSFSALACRQSMENCSSFISKSSRLASDRSRQRRPAVSSSLLLTRCNRG